MENDDELLEIRQIFVQEAFELIETLEKKFLLLDEDHTLIDALNEAFRIAHNLKGSSAAIGLDHISTFAHKFENLLTFLRMRPDLNSKDRNGLLLETTDLLRSCFTFVAASQEIDKAAVDKMISRINAEAAIVEAEMSSKKKSEDSAPNVEATHDENDVAGEKKTGQVGQQVLKVSIDRLNGIQQVVGELATLRAQLLSNILEPRQLQIVVSIMDKNIRELNERVLDLKKSSLDPLRQRVSRVVRDTSHKLHKPISFHFTSNNDFIEKPILDALVDPLVHMVRNSLDHGLETPSERLEIGKSEIGELSIHINVEPTVVEITIKDDGRGIDAKKILAKAKEKEIVGPEADNWPEGKILELLFAPGFSTAEQVSEFSGRGVGLDVVRSNIESLGGSLQIKTEMNRGTEFVLQIPMCNGLSEALSIKHNGKSYLVSISGVTRVINIDRKKIKTPVPDLIVYQMAGVSHQFIPLDTDLDDLVISDRAIGIMVQVIDKHYCIPVDHVGSKGQHMIKPIGRWMSSAPGILGMSIIGDGTPVPFLDLKKLIIEKTSFRSNLDNTPKEKIA